MNATEIYVDVRLNYVLALPFDYSLALPLNYILPDRQTVLVRML